MKLRMTTKLLSFLLCLSLSDALRGGSYGLRDDNIGHREAKAKGIDKELSKAPKQGETRGEGKRPTKGNGKEGAKSNHIDESVFDTEDVYLVADDPEPDESPSDPVESFLPLKPNDSMTMERSIPVFTIRYTITTPGTPAGDDGNYNELAIVTQEYLDEYFDAIFEASSAHHAFTTAKLRKTGDPLSVEFHVGSNFHIPGELPTISFMFERILEAFGGTGESTYLNELSEMSGTNPFSETSGVELLTGNGLQSSGPAKKAQNKSVMAPFLGGIGFLVLAIVGFFWLKQRRSQRGTGIDELNLEEEDPSRNKGGIGNKSTATPYRTPVKAPDETTLRYLYFVRERFHEESDIKSSKSTNSANTSLETEAIEEEIEKTDEINKRNVNPVPNLEGERYDGINLHHSCSVKEDEVSPEAPKLEPGNADKVAKLENKGLNYLTLEDSDSSFDEDLRD